MSAVAVLLDDLRRHDVLVRVRGTVVEVDGPETVLTEDVLKELRAQKPAIIKHARILEMLENAACAVSGEYNLITSDDLISRLCESDLEDIQLMAPSGLLAFAHAVQVNMMRENGVVPPRWTASTVCQHCGDVPIFPGCSPRVDACPWCFNRVAGKPLPTKISYGRQ